MTSFFSLDFFSTLYFTDLPGYDAFLISQCLSIHVVHTQLW